MSKVTIVLSIGSDPVSRFLFDDYINACNDAGIVVRYEPYTLDVDRKSTRLNSSHT